MAKAESKSTTRRAVLAGIATAPALAAPAVAAAGAYAPPDPIFVAIERHRTALVAFETAPSDDELDAAGDVHRDALGDLLGTKPTTVAGCVAVLRYVDDLVHEGHGGMFDDCGLFDSWCEPVSRPGGSFLGLIADALASLR
jgi:hypothetical protein